MSLEASWMLYNCDEALFLWTIKDAGALSLLRSIPDHYRWVFPVNHRHCSRRMTTSPFLLPSYYFKSKSQGRHRAQHYDQFITCCQSIRGRNRGLASLPSGPTPPAHHHHSSSAIHSHSRLYLSPSEQSIEQSFIAAWSVELCGYANVSRLVGVLLNGRAEEVNKRVWMRGGGQRVKEMK